MTPQEFIAKWRSGGDERRDWHSFFDDLCRLVGHKTPREADPEHTWFTYEYGVGKAAGGLGWADAWKKGYFGWEAKGTGKDLQRAYAQLKMYSDDLQNPPLLVVCDLQRFEVHTNFTNSVKTVYRFTVDDLANAETRRVLRAVFHDPNELRPGTTRSEITAAAAEKFADLAQALRSRGEEPHAVAHFLNRLLFCMFAEDIGLLPAKLFTRMIEGSQDDPADFEANARQLFAAMRKGGQAGFTRVDWFNGGLFDHDQILRLEREELRTLLTACRLDWSQIDPSIFGTLFERGLDPSKRSQLGAHYTDPTTIMKLIRPVIIEPWLAEWEIEKGTLAPLLEKAAMRASHKGESAAKKGARTKAYTAAQARLVAFLERLQGFTVLDPACGSGNFLFMSLQALKDVEQRVLVEAEEMGLPRQMPGVGPHQVKGIEINDYAAELARITVWIGELQWMIQNGYGARKNPILLPLDQIENRDALLNVDGTEATWPKADAIVGNPPFIGGNKMRSELGAAYSTAVRGAYRDRVSSGADFVCFWFEKARAAISAEETQRAGLVATNSIRHGKNRKVLDRVKANLHITTAWSSEEWWDNNAAVDVSLIAFGPAQSAAGVLDGKPVREITSSLTELVNHDIAKAKVLAENRKRSFQGVIPRAELKRTTREKLGLDLPKATFNLDGADARQILQEPATPKGEPMSAVVRPYLIADEITTRPLDRFIVNFRDRSKAEASMFAKPYAAITNVRLHREHMPEVKDREHWWQLSRWRPAMVKELEKLTRYISIPRHAKHYLCVWTHSAVLPDSALVVVARDDDTSIGILQSKIHEVWALRQGSELEDRPRNTPSTSFETFPFPEGLTPNTLASAYSDDPRAQAIAAAAKELIRARDGWLNPPDLAQWVPEVVDGFPPHVVAKPGCATKLAQRTLTNLYNERPEWLADLHDKLDKAVAAAYGWEWPLDAEEILRRLFELNAERAASQP